jgi:predicted ABC-type ATPase
MQSKMIIVAGPPGSGKSTAFPVHSFGLDFFNADDRAAALNAGSYQGIPSSIRTQVAEEFEAFIAAQIKLGKSFAIETTLRTNVTFRQAQQAREAGFQIEMLYINAGDFEHCLKRVIARGFAGGHSAPAEQLKTIYEASLLNLKTAIQEMDEIRVYDNSQPGMTPALALEAIHGEIQYIAPQLPDWLDRILGSALKSAEKRFEENKEKIIFAVKRIVGLLVQKRFDDIDLLTHKVQCDARTLMHWVDDIGWTLVQPPDEAFLDIEYSPYDSDDAVCNTAPFPVGHPRNSMHVFEQLDSTGRQLAVDFDVWTLEEGRSDFTLQLTLRLNKEGSFEVTVENLHVM